MHTINRRQPTWRTTTGRIARHTERGKGALLVQVPTLQAQGALMGKTARLTLLDNQRTDQAAPKLLAATKMRVIPIAAGIRGDEVVVEILARQHRQLRHIGHAVHRQWQTNAVPV